MKVSIAIITCQRPAALARLLSSLDALETTADVEIIVVDNDSAQSATPSIADYSGKHKLVSIYEQTPGIPYARNAALKACRVDADYIAFLDDDETPSARWLSHMLQTISATGADAVGGPVTPLFPDNTPLWIINGGFFEREQKPDQQPCHILATNNCLIKMASWRKSPIWFDTRLQYTGSSDTLFFIEARKLGWRFAWAAKAEVFEAVPLQRLSAQWIIQRQYRIGNGLSLCDILAKGYLRTAPLRTAKAGVYALAGLAHLLRYPFTGQVAWVKAQASWARAGGGITALLGCKYKEYAPHKLVRETP